VNNPPVSGDQHDVAMPKRNGSGIDLLADPTRRRLVALIALGKGHPSKLAKEIGLSRPATSRQLRILRDAKLVRRTRSATDGRAYFYSIEQRRLGQITAWLAGVDIGRTGPRWPSPWIVYDDADQRGRAKGDGDGSA
jgi:DNA-binding transcriptional ArsR family regulator